MGSLKNEEELEQMVEESKEAILYVNGVRKVLPDGLAHFTLLEYLRAYLKFGDFSGVKPTFGFSVFHLLI
ncbi:hypothetical protein COLO4_24881 [Corchorus olitorius]|uniref:Uncharacterized protein n=1 Tax=Corchorus olitorius TaxID=93759 RepID=A0A1R3I5W8_9ROSI|nr:hypothetical protein COLO4_24881 [Corchorus olitorius]